MASVLQQGLSAGTAWPPPGPRTPAVLRRDAAAAAPSQGLPVAVQGVRKAFGGREVLRDVDLRIAPGQFVAVVGRSGSGKSTLLRLLAGLEQPSAGTISLDAAPPAARREAIRVMFQDGRLLPWKRVLDNVALGLTDDGPARAGAALAAVGLGERAAEWPRVLSGGQQQRVALARALAASPRLMLLDEPLGALDALTRLEMQRLLERLWQQAGFTALLVTHDVSEAALLADRILLIENGRIGLDLAVSLPRPREPSRELAAIEAEVLARIFAGT